MTFRNKKRKALVDIRRDGSVKILEFSDQRVNAGKPMYHRLEVRCPYLSEPEPTYAKELRFPNRQY